MACANSKWLCDFVPVGYNQRPALGLFVESTMVETLIRSHWPVVRTDTYRAFGNADGFSGAQLWRVETSAGSLCLRRWPKQHPSAEHLRWIHSVLRRAADNGCGFLPVPLPTHTGDTFASQNGYQWELTPWMPGKATLPSAYSNERCESACRALAQFHKAIQPAARQHSPSPTIRQRLATSERFQDDAASLSSAVDHLPAGAIRGLCSEVLAHALPRNEELPLRLRQHVNVPLPLQPCIRDVWYPHIFFEGNSVTGLVDFGAMRVDSVTLDLARLLSSIDLGRDEVWHIGMTAYESIRPLSPDERAVLQMMPGCVPVLSGLQWVRWLAMERRTFDQLDRVIARLQEIVEKFQHAS